MPTPEQAKNLTEEGREDWGVSDGTLDSADTDGIFGRRFKIAQNARNVSDEFDPETAATLYPEATSDQDAVAAFRRQQEDSSSPEREGTHRRKRKRPIAKRKAKRRRTNGEIRRQRSGGGINGTGRNFPEDMRGSGKRPKTKRIY